MPRLRLRPWGWASTASEGCVIPCQEFGDPPEREDAIVVDTGARARSVVLQMMRDHVLRRGPDGASRQANLAVNYLDAYAPAVLAELHPTSWPRVVVLDATTLFTRGYRPTSDDPAEARSGSLRAGTILVALDGASRRPRPCLMAVAGAKDASSWRALFGRLDGAPEVVVADLDPAIGRAVRETWPGAIVIASRHHVAAQIRERVRADGVPERIRLETPVASRRALPWTGEPGRRFGPPPSTRPLFPPSVGRPSGTPSGPWSSATSRPTASPRAAG